MSSKVHRHCVKAAGNVSPRLKAALVRVGRIALPQRRGRGLPYFLGRAVVGQQLSTLAARSIWARVETAVQANRSAIPAFFCEHNQKILRECGISNAKVRALIAIREANEAGKLSVPRLRKMGHRRRSEHLQEIWGIGQWTADMTSIFYFGDPDVWPEGDGGVQRAFCMLTGKRSKTSLAKLAAAFAPYRSFLAIYMWRVLDQPKAAAQTRPRKITKAPL